MIHIHRSMINIHRHLLPAVFVVSMPIGAISAFASDTGAPAAAANPAAHAAAPAAKPDESASYSLGLSFATQWRESGLNDLLDENGLIRGIRAGLAAKPFSDEDRKRASALLHDAYAGFAAHNKAAAAKFLAKNAKEPGVTTTISGLQYLVMKKGEPNATPAGPNDHVTLQYRGLFINGTEFDSSARHGEPAVIRPSTVIAGWREALSMMGRGAQWRVFVPPELAYGMTPPPAIPPNALLIFEIEVVGIEPGGTPPVAAK